jgi:hypothetical protein
MDVGMGKRIAPAILAIAFAACGGGGSTGGSAVTVTGTVPGSLFVAVDNATNVEVTRAAASGTPKRFTMTLSTGKRYRFFLVENESAGSGARVYPYRVGGADVVGMTADAAGTTVDLGSVAPDMATGYAVSVNDPTAHAGISAMGTNGTMPPTLAPMAFVPDNLAGTWHFDTLTTSGTMGWSHGTLAVDNSGRGTWSSVMRNGTAVAAPGPVSYSLSPGGMMHDPADNSFLSLVSKGRDLMVARFTDNTGGYSLMVAQKGSGAPRFANEMDGTWRFHRLTAGSDNTTAGWAVGTMTIAGGGATVTTIATDKGSTAETGRIIDLSMAADGVLSSTAVPSFDGCLSADGKLIVGTDNGATGPEMWVIVRSGGTLFSTADLAGDWLMGGVISGDAASRDWISGMTVIDGAGQAGFPMMAGAGGMTSFPSSTLSMASPGTFSMTGMSGGGMGGGGMMGSTVVSTYRGTMAPSKDFAVSTFSDGTGGYRLWIQVK